MATEISGGGVKLDGTSNIGTGGPGGGCTGSLR